MRARRVLLSILLSGAAFSALTTLSASAAEARPEPIINTEGLLNHTANGNAPRAGVHPYWSSYRALRAILSLRGPLGPKGPLGEKGALGDQPQNPMYWWSKWLERDVWAYASHDWFEENGPHSAKGPFGDQGPVSQDWGEGAYSILGTTGPLGELGALGSAGILGAVQSTGKIKGPDENGAYHDRESGAVVRELRVPFKDGYRMLRTVERYKESYALDLSKRNELDTTFWTQGQFDFFDVERSFTVTSDRDEVLSLLVVPEAGLMVNILGLPQRLNFDIEAQTLAGEKIIDSIRLHHANFVQLKLPHGESVKIIVRRQGVSTRPQGYRLFVIGAPFNLYETQHDNP